MGLPRAPPHFDSAIIAAAGSKVFVYLFVFYVREISLTEAHNLQALILVIHHTRFSDFNNEKSFFLSSRNVFQELYSFYIKKFQHLLLIVLAHPVDLVESKVLRFSVSDFITIHIND